MQIKDSKALPAAAAHFCRSYPGTKDQVSRVRADLADLVGGFPVADDFILLASEIAANVVVHSRSGEPGGTFTVRARARAGEYARMEVEDQGGPWTAREPDDEHGRGLAIVDAIAGTGNWGIKRSNARDTRVTWFQLRWPAPGQPSDDDWEDSPMRQHRCSCGYKATDLSGLTDHLHEAFTPGDDTDANGVVHAEAARDLPGNRPACLCGVTAEDLTELDSHLLTAFTPPSGIGADGVRHAKYPI